MKKIFAVLSIVLSTTVYAGKPVTPVTPGHTGSTKVEMIAYASNHVGGRIVLTQPLCRYGLGLVAFSTDNSGNMVDTGCWSKSKPFYLVNWNSNHAVNWYNQEDFSYADVGE